MGLLQVITAATDLRKNLFDLKAANFIVKKEKKFNTL